MINIENGWYLQEKKHVGLPLFVIVTKQLCCSFHDNNESKDQASEGRTDGQISLLTWDGTSLKGVVFLIAYMSWEET